ncbi:MAG: ASCH domain-containing protein [Anaerolineae bacterium]
MKALTLLNPWATLIAIGAKRIETRGWTTSWRGPLAIHAAARAMDMTALELCAREPIRKRLVDAGYREPFEASLPFGAVVAICRVGYVIRAGHASMPACLERLCGDFSPGRWEWHLVDVERLAKPVPAKGAMRLWEWDMPVDPSTDPQYDGPHYYRDDGTPI